MKKSELDTIIKKIQNRCYLENPTKITYYRNENGEVIFKAFFDSLVIPESLRLGVQDIQNTFTVANTYEYEDDFQILSLNQDKGYVEFIPDNQHFHIVNSYKDANKPEDKKEESLVHIASNKLNEAFARAKGYILQESDAEKIANREAGGSLKNSDEAKETAESGEEKLHPKNAYVIGVTAPCTKKGEMVISKALEKVKQDSEAMVFLTIPKDEKIKETPSVYLSVQNVFSEQVRALLGKSSVAYFAYEGNTYCLGALSKADIKSITYLTTTAKQGIADNNTVKLTSPGPEVEVIEKDLIEDDSAEGLAPVIEKLSKKTEDFAKLVKDDKLRGIFADTCSKGVLKKYESVKNEATTKASRSILADLYGRGGLEEAKEAKKQRDKIIQATLQNLENPAAMEQAKTFQDKCQVALTVFYAQAENSIASIVTDRKQAKDNNENGGSGMFAGMKNTKAYNASSETGDAKPQKSKSKAPAKIGMMDYWCYMYFFESLLNLKKVPSLSGFAKDVQDLIELLSLKAFQEDSQDTDKKADEGNDGEEEEEKKNDEGSENNEESEDKGSDSKDSKDSNDKGDAKDSGDKGKKDESRKFGNYERLLEIWGLNE